MAKLFRSIHSIFDHTLGIILVLVQVLFSLSIQTVSAAPVRGTPGDTWADIVLGKGDFATLSPYTTTAGSLFMPQGALVDRTNAAGEGEKLYVYDAGNSRILGYDLEDCRNIGGNPLNCTAEIVLGQPDFDSSACNGDSNYQNYPDRAVPSASTLCGIPEHSLSPSEGGGGAAMAVDADGNLYTADYWNHRILVYYNPFGPQTGGAGDGIADDVWGQDDFTSKLCNKGGSDPTDSSLCFSWGISNNGVASVDIDSHGNLWVTDTDNNRVLRFPESGGAPAKTADLVLGQEDFVTKGGGDALDKMSDPSGLKVTADDVVYVSDRWNDRVVRYATLTNGADGEIFGADFLDPTGITLDPTEAGNIWIMNAARNLAELWDMNAGTQVRTVGTLNEANIAGDVGGSLGVDADGNLYMTTGTGVYNNNVIIFDKSAPNQLDITTQLVTPTGHGNIIDQNRMAGVHGLVVTDDQVIASDKGRLLFWNTPNGISDLTTGKPPDGVIGVADFNSYNGACCETLKTDEIGNLYVATNTEAADIFGISIYSLPLTSGDSPDHVIQMPIPLLGGGNVEYTDPFQVFSGIQPAPDGSYLWGSLAPQNRVIRIRNPLTDPEVDVILGQDNNTNYLCNRIDDVNAETADSLCNPGHISFDHYGNLYIEDDWLEIFGNYRLLRYNVGKFPTDNTSVIYATEPDYVYDNVATWGPTFDLFNKMVLGFNTYYDFAPEIAPNDGWFPALYNTPLADGALPDDHLEDYYSMAFASAFDKDNNLYVGDLNRGRILIYQSPLGNDAPTITEVTPVPPSSSDTTPSLTIGTNKAGVASFGGACSGQDDVELNLGDNTITFDPLAEGTYSNCTVTVTDPSDQDSNVLALSSFTITGSGPSPTPTPGPSNNGSSGSVSSSGTSAPSTPTCGDWRPVGQADLFQITRQGQTAKLFFTPVNDNVSNYHVVYGFKEGEERFGQLSAPITRESNGGVQSITIGNLDPKVAYWFRVSPVNGCAVGDWSGWLRANRLVGRLTTFYKYVTGR